MAQHKTDFTGAHYLFDSEDAREYLILMDKGQPVSLAVCEPGREKSGFRPGETVFAIDDQPFFKGAAFGVTVFQIDADAEGRHTIRNPINVDYQLNVRKRREDYFVTCTLTPESQETLKLAGLSADFPSRFEKPVTEGLFKNSELALGILTVEDVMGDFRFPPHQNYADGRAALARDAGKSGILPLPVKIADDWERPAQLVTAFTLVAAPATVIENAETILSPNPKTGRRQARAGMRR